MVLVWRITDILPKSPKFPAIQYNLWPYYINLQQCGVNQVPPLLSKYKPPHETHNIKVCFHQACSVKRYRHYLLCYEDIIYHRYIFGIKYVHLLAGLVYCIHIKYFKGSNFYGFCNKMEIMKFSSSNFIGKTRDNCRARYT